jgi:hypothetical protein
MRINAASGASVKWYSGGTLAASASGGGVFTWTTNVASGTSNSVVVSPADKLLGIGVGTSSSDNNDNGAYTLTSVGGLTNYPALYEVYFYKTWVTNLSLAGCTNLSAAALVNTAPGNAQGNQWFNELRDAGATNNLSRQPQFVQTAATFYHPLGVTLDTPISSLDARNFLTSHGWQILRY